MEPARRPERASSGLTGVDEDPLREEITIVAGKLEARVDKPEQWRSLRELVDGLTRDLRPIIDEHATELAQLPNGVPLASKERY